MRRAVLLLTLLTLMALPALAQRPGPVEVRTDAKCPAAGGTGCTANVTVFCSPSRTVMVCASGTWVDKGVKVTTGTTPPGTCAVGDLFQDTDAAANAQLLVCEAANTWRAQGGGGSGDITAVGPGCASGACFTDGVATTGTTMFAWEGNANDSTEWYMDVPLNPAADRTVTFPDASGDVVLNPAGTGYPMSQCANWDGAGQLTGTGLACSPSGADKIYIGSGAGTLNVTTPSCNLDSEALGYDSGSHAFVCGDDDKAVPGGTTGQLQYNDGASGFAAATVTWDTGNSQLVTGTINNLKIINSDINRWKWQLGSGGFENWTWGAYSFDVEGSSDDTAETTVTFTNPTVDRTITVPDASGTLCLDSGSGCGGGGGTTRRTVGVTVDGGSSSPATGIKGSTRIAVAGTIKKWTILADAVGSIQFGVWKDTLANYPPTVADSICASACPALTSDDAGEDATLTGWTTSVAAGDVIRFNLNSVATIKWATLIIEIEETF